jgi:DNA-binding response OmpR family regulator
MVSTRGGQYQDIDVILADPNDTVRYGLMGMLRQQGLRKIRAVNKLSALTEELKSSPADLIAVSDTLGDSVFSNIRNLRHNKLGGNPFAIVTFMVSPENQSSVKQAIMAGADDVMLKPVAPGKIVARAQHIAYNRIPFIATTEYIGPNRRKDGRKSDIPLINVINTFKAKMDGKEVKSEVLEQAVDQNFKSIRTAQLDSQGLRLGYVCDLILTAYDEGKVDQEVEHNLLVLVQCLEEASDAATAVGEPELSTICSEFRHRIEAMSGHYMTPDEKSLNLIRKLTKAFQMAKEAASARMPKMGFQKDP